MSVIRMPKIFGARRPAQEPPIGWDQELRALEGMAEWLATIPDKEKPMPCPYCGYPINPGAANHPDCVAKRIEQLESAMTALRLTARILLQNSEGCAVNHYGEDYYLHGEPGWLADSRKSIEAAEAALRNSPEGVPT